jgi:hypothetical protein
MSKSTRDQRMTPGLAPVAFVDLTVPRANEAGRSFKQGKAIEDKGKGKAEEGQDKTLTEKEGAVVGGEAGERASVGMASSGASSESAGARRKRQPRRGGDGRSRRHKGGRGGPGWRSRGQNARITVRGACARTAGAPPSASTTE